MSYSYQKGSSWLMVVSGIAVGAVLAGLCFFIFFRGNSKEDKKTGETNHVVKEEGVMNEVQRKAALMEALNNAKMVSAALNLFRQDKGSYPDKLTAEFLVEDGVDNLPKGNHANAYLAQLVASQYLIGEELFFVPGLEGVRKGDNLTSPGKLLAAGENGFSYVMAEEDFSLGGDKSRTPLVLAPAAQGGSDPRFDSKIFGGKYVCGMVDGSSRQGEIGENGTALARDGANLFETGRNSLFYDVIPVVKMPLMK